MLQDGVPLHMPTYLMCWPDTAVEGEGWWGGLVGGGRG